MLEIVPQIYFPFLHKLYQGRVYFQRVLLFYYFLDLHGLTVVVAEFQLVVHLAGVIKEQDVIIDQILILNVIGHFFQLLFYEHVKVVDLHVVPNQYQIETVHLLQEFVDLIVFELQVHQERVFDHFF